MENDAEILTLDGFYDTVLIRFSGEIGIKSERVRKRLLGNVVRHLKSILERRDIQGYEITKTRARIYIKPGGLDQFPLIHEVLKNIPGVHSYSYCTFTQASLERMKETVTALGNLLWSTGDTFAIRVKREGKHEFTSQDLERAIGAHVLETFKDQDLSVDLSKPEKTVYLEVRGDRVAVYHEKFPGFGGMPRDNIPYLLGCVGLSERHWVAAKSVLKRGARLFPVLLLQDIEEKKGGLVESLNNDTRLVDQMQDLLDIQENNAVPLFAMVFPPEFNKFLANRGIDSESDEINFLLAYHASVKVYEELRQNGEQYLKKAPEVRGVVLQYHYDAHRDPRGLESMVAITRGLETLLPEGSPGIPKFYTNVFESPTGPSNSVLEGHNPPAIGALKGILEDEAARGEMAALLEKMSKNKAFLKFDLVSKVFLSN